MRTILGSLAAQLLILSGALFLSTPSASASAADMDCGDFANQADAQNYFVSLGGPTYDPDRLDADDDGIACDTLPCPCSSSTGGGGGNAAVTHRASVKLSIAKARVGRHDWRFVCKVQRAGRPYTGKVVKYQWRDKNHPRWHYFVESQTGQPARVKTGPAGKAKMRVVWAPPRGQARCVTAATSRTKAGQSHPMAVAPR
jgi:hypothetical protein